jgi:hypothetical protein
VKATFAAAALTALTDARARGSSRRRRTTSPVAAVALAATAALALAACGSDGDDSAPADTATPTTALVGGGAPPESTPETTDAVDTMLDVTMTDYSFGDLPDEVMAGTRLTIDNQSPTELHELVAVRLPDGDDRPTREIIESGLGELLGSAPPSAVLLAAPGGDQISAVGDGVLAQPGRYLLLCAIPTGADPDEYLAAAANSDGPPQVEGGPPHFVYGMVDEILVTH